MGAAPSRTRFGVLYFGVTLAVIQYIDRVCIAQAMPDIRSDLGITGAQYDDYVGYVFSSFALALRRLVNSFSGPARSSAVTSSRLISTRS